MTNGCKIEINCSNVSGHGAVQVCRSLVPALVDEFGCENSIIVLPENSKVSESIKQSGCTNFRFYNRRLPLIFSRFVEVTLFSFFNQSKSSLFVLGDFPHITTRFQTLLFHNLSILEKPAHAGVTRILRYKFMLMLFQFNLRFVDLIFVQSELVAKKLSDISRRSSEKIRVIPNPPPSWVSLSRSNACIRTNANNKLVLFYPASYYPHKNHKLINQLNMEELNQNVERIILTIDSSSINFNCEKIECVGALNIATVAEYYQASDGLLFLSEFESLGLPLLEAMTLNRHIICPDLPYAKHLCGNNAIYFKSNDPASLMEAMKRLKILKNNDIRVNWSTQLARFPRDWTDVSGQMFQMIKRRLSK